MYKPVLTLDIVLLPCVSLFFSATQLRSLRAHVAEYSQVLDGLPIPWAALAPQLTRFCLLTDGEESEEFMACCDCHHRIPGACHGVSLAQGPDNEPSRSSETIRTVQLHVNDAETIGEPTWDHLHDVFPHIAQDTPPEEEYPPLELDAEWDDSRTEDDPAAAPSPPPPWEAGWWHETCSDEWEWNPPALVDVNDEELEWPPCMLLEMEHEADLGSRSLEEVCPTLLESEVDAYLEDLDLDLPEGITVAMLL